MTDPKRRRPPGDGGQRADAQGTRAGDDSTAAADRSVSGLYRSWLAIPRSALAEIRKDGNPSATLAVYTELADRVRYAQNGGWVTLGGQRHQLAYGECLVSGRNLATTLSLTHAQVKRSIRSLETAQLIARRTAQGKTILTVCGYADFLTQAKAASPKLSPKQSPRDRPGSAQTIAQDPPKLSPETDTGDTDNTVDTGDTGRGRRKRPAKPIPSDWAPTDSHRQLAQELGLDAEREGAKFADHARAKDRRLVDWGAAFRNWLRKSAEWRKSDESIGPYRPTGDEEFAGGEVKI